MNTDTDSATTHALRPGAGHPRQPYLTARLEGFGTAIFTVAIASKLILRSLGEPIEADAPQSIGEVDVGEVGPEI